MDVRCFLIHALPKSKPKKRSIQVCLCACICVCFVSILTPHSHKLHVFLEIYLQTHVPPKFPTQPRTRSTKTKKKKTLRRHTRWLRLWLTHGPILLTFPIKDVDRGPWMETPLRWVAWGVGGKNRSCFIIFLLCGGMLNIAADLAYSVWNSYFTLHTFKNPQKNIYNIFYIYLYNLNFIVYIDMLF